MPKKSIEVDEFINKPITTLIEEDGIIFVVPTDNKDSHEGSGYDDCSEHDEK